MTWHKMCCFFTLQVIPELLAPQQLGIGVPNGVKAAVHATHVFLHNLQWDRLVVELDIQSLIPLNMTKSFQMWKSNDDEVMLSSEGVQQGNPLGSSSFSV